MEDRLERWNGVLRHLREDEESRPIDEEREEKRRVRLEQNSNAETRWSAIRNCFFVVYFLAPREILLLDTCLLTP